MTGATGSCMSFFFFILFVYCVYAKLVLWFYFVKYTTPKKSNFVFYSFWHIDCYLQWMLWENFIHILQYKCLHFITHYHWKLYLCLASKVSVESIMNEFIFFYCSFTQCDRAVNKFLLLFIEQFALLFCFFLFVFSKKSSRFLLAASIIDLYNTFKCKKHHYLLLT